jgi:hypothetical protein
MIDERIASIHAAEVEGASEAAQEEEEGDCGELGHARLARGRSDLRQHPFQTCRGRRVWRLKSRWGMNAARAAARTTLRLIGENGQTGSRPHVRKKRHELCTGETKQQGTVRGLHA